MRTNTLFKAVAGLAITCGAAMGGVTITQGTSAPGYSSTLNFDEVGAPTGTGLATSSWTAWGVNSITAGDGNQVVDDVTGLPGYSWLGTGNSFYGNFGVVIELADDVDAFSVQVWDPSGPPSFIGGGLAIFLYDDGNEVGNAFGVTPAWGGVGDEWFNMVADSGTKFDQITIFGLGSFPTTYVDNLSWHTVPAPSTAALFGIGALAARRRRA